MRSVTPLPATLSGNIIERLIQIDESLIPYVNGALVWLCDKEPFEETGTLTVDQAKILFSDMLQIYFTESPAMTPIGATIMWMTDTIPDKWLELGGQALSKTTYPELFDIFGYTHGGGSDTFVLPSYRGYSPYGAGADINIQEKGGAATRNININNLPAHNHAVIDAGHTHRIINRNGVASNRHTGTAGANPSNAENAAGTTNSAVLNDTTSSTTGITTGNTGSGDAINILHPVFAARYIIYAGH